VCGFGERHAFAGAGLEDAQRPGGGSGGRRCGECSIERGFGSSVGKYPFFTKLRASRGNMRAMGISWQ